METRPPVSLEEYNELVETAANKARDILQRLNPSDVMWFNGWIIGRLSIIQRFPFQAASRIDELIMSINSVLYGQWPHGFHHTPEIDNLLRSLLNDAYDLERIIRRQPDLLGQPITNDLTGWLAYQNVNSVLRKISALKNKD